MSPPPENRTLFVADAMLGSLARKLRALGFDTNYYKVGGDAGIIKAAAREGRIILTSDRSLAKRGSDQHVNVFFLDAKTDGARISSISRDARRAGIKLTRGDPLCSLCGGELSTLRKADVTGQVPPLVERRHRLFYKCKSCGHLYWRGSHWKKLRSLARRLE